MKISLRNLLLNRSVKILVFGTFDIFHPGHVSFLKQARAFGDHLSVVIARDKTVLKVKHALPRNNEKQRLETVKNSGLADCVVLGSLGDKYKIIQKIKPDIICLGYDQTFFIEQIKEKLDEFGFSKTKLIRLKPFQENIYKSSKLKKD